MVIDYAHLEEPIVVMKSALLVVAPIGVILTALGSMLVARNALRPLGNLSSEISRLSARDLDRRLEMPGAEKELEPLVSAYNDILQRLETSFHQANRFSGEASKELKNPLALMQARLELALGRSETEGETYETPAVLYSQLLEDIHRQQGVLATLLLLTRADAGKLALTRQRFSLSEYAELWMEDLGILAEGAGVSVEWEVEEDLDVEADPVLLQQVFHHLFANAIHHREDNGSPIRCRLLREGGKASFLICNEGLEFSQEEQSQLFDRYYQVAESAAGKGLGLSLAREIAWAHEGSLEYLGCQEGRHEFRLQLPLTGTSRETTQSQSETSA